MRQGLWIGFMAGCAMAALGIGLLISAFGEEADKALDNCAKSNNVYQCEMVAVPKSGDK